MLAGANVSRHKAIGLCHIKRNAGQKVNSDFDYMPRGVSELDVGKHAGAVGHGLPARVLDACLVLGGQHLAGGRLILEQLHVEAEVGHDARQRGGGRGRLAYITYM